MGHLQQIKDTIKGVRQGSATLAISALVLSISIVGSVFAAVTVPVTDTAGMTPAVVGSACIVEGSATCRTVDALASAGNATVGYTIYGGGIVDTITDRAVGNADVTGYANLFRFNGATGALDRNFKPQFVRSGGTLESSKVTAILIDPDTNSMYVGGNFLQVKNNPTATAVNRYAVAKFDLTTGLMDTAFDARICTQATGTTRSGVCTVDTLAFVGNGTAKRLAIGGGFSMVRGTSQAAFVTVNPSTGAIDSATNKIAISTPIFPVGIGQTPTGMKVQGISLSADRTKMAIHGNFSRVAVNGAAAVTRQQVAIVRVDANTGVPIAMSTWNPPSLTTSTPTLATDATNPCHNNIPHPAQIVWDPDNTRFFMISWAGGGTGTGTPLNILCDSITAWSTSETTSVSNVTQFYNRTYGDTILSGCYQNKALYVGGHFRSLNYKVYVNGVNRTPSYPSWTDDQGRAYSGEIHWGLGVIETDVTNTSRYGLAVATWNDTTETGKGFGWNASLCINAPANKGGGVYFGGDSEKVNGNAAVKRLVRFPASN